MRRFDLWSAISSFVAIVLLIVTSLLLLSAGHDIPALVVALVACGPLGVFMESLKCL